MFGCRKKKQQQNQSINYMDTKTFFGRGDEFKNNPLHFAVHRISNMGTFSEVFNAKMRLLKGDTDGCLKKLEKIEAEMIEQIEFLRKFAKEYGEFMEAGNVIIPPRTKYTIALVETIGQVEEGKTLLLYPDGSIKYHPLYGLALDDIKGIEVLIVSDEEVEDQELHYDSKYRELHFHKHRNNEESCMKIIGKAPQFIIDGLISKEYFEGDSVKIKMTKRDKQVQYKDGEHAREYMEVEVPEVNSNGIVTCEK